MDCRQRRHSSSSPDYTVYIVYTDFTVYTVYTHILGFREIEGATLKNNKFGGIKWIHYLNGIRHSGHLIP